MKQTAKAAITAAKDIPKTMRAAQGKDFGDIDQMLSVEDGVPVPRLGDDIVYTVPKHPLLKSLEKKAASDHMIVKTLAVALAPGDCRVLSGKTRFFQGPPSFPYVPVGDCCGVVVEIPPDETYFKVGDVVASRFVVAPRDCLAEYARISRLCCDKVDLSKDLNPEEAAALASASPATILADYIRPNERILILGAGGGIGSHLCQLARRAKGASYICGVGCDTERLLKAPLSCDSAVDYTKEDVFSLKKYQEEPFDTIIDLATGGWPRLVEASRQKIPSIVKTAAEGGRFLTICPDKPTFEAKSILTILSIFMFRPLWRAITSRLFTRRSLPTFTYANGLPDERDVITRTFRWVSEGKLKGIVDGPFQMTSEGVRKAFRLLESRHPQGKVVIKVSDL